MDVTFVEQEDDHLFVDQKFNDRFEIMIELSTNVHQGTINAAGVTKGHTEPNNRLTKAKRKHVVNDDFAREMKLARLAEDKND